MERKINWCTYCHDEIDLVYDKANEDENIAAALMELETTKHGLRNHILAPYLIH